jgi:hypothetical protein
MKHIIHGESYDAALFSGVFGEQPDLHPDILDIDDVLLKYASSEKIDRNTLLNLSPGNGVAFLTISRNGAHYLLLVPFHESETEIIKLNLIVQALPALAA